MKSELWNLVWCFCSDSELFCFSITKFDFMGWNRSQCLTMTSLIDDLYILNLVEYFQHSKKNKKTLSPHGNWYSRSVAMAVVSKLKSLHCFQSNRKSWALSLSIVLPEAAGSQDPQVFHTHQPLLNIPTAPDQSRSCCSPPLQIRFQGHCEKSLLWY